MKPVTLMYLVLALGLGACEPKAPEKPNKPPTPNAATLSAQTESGPAFKSHIDANGKRTAYSAFFDGQQLTQINEAEGASGGVVSEYRYHGARLLKYSRAASGETTVLELDDQGRVQRAVAGTRELAAAEIDVIRTHAQLLRSHALAQRASRLHTQ